jgi:hypothetical protein
MADAITASHTLHRRVQELHNIARTLRPGDPNYVVNCASLRMEADMLHHVAKALETGTTIQIVQE